MNKQLIISNKKSLIEWANTLKEISDEQWFKPFREGGWGTADVISHFISWDRFIIENRITFLLKNEDFPKVDIDVEAMNSKASNYARSGISKEELINTFISVRFELIKSLERIPAERYDQPFPGKEHITLNEYFLGMIEHDEKHRQQIEALLKN